MNLFNYNNYINRLDSLAKRSTSILFSVSIATVSLVVIKNSLEELRNKKHMKKTELRGDGIKIETVFCDKTNNKEGCNTNLECSREESEARQGTNDVDVKEIYKDDNLTVTEISAKKSKKKKTVKS